MNKSKKIGVCPICESAELSEFACNEVFRYENKEIQIDGYLYSKCNDCEFEFVTPDQKRKNDCKVRDARRKADGLLTGIEIKLIRKSLELSQEEAAKIFGGGRNAFSKYERGEVTQSLAMDKLLRVSASSEEVLNMISGSPEVFSKGRLISEYEPVCETAYIDLHRKAGFKLKTGGRKSCATIYSYKATDTTDNDYEILAAA